jgi:hypothetical protein
VRVRVWLKVPAGYPCRSLSITSPEALSTLRNLHQPNPLLFDELSRNTLATDEADALQTEEAAFTDVVEDDSDIPIDVVKSHIASKVVDEGFIVDGDGNLLRASVVEDVDFDQAEEDSKEVVDEAVAEPALGKGHRAKKARKLYGGTDAWNIG